MSAIPTREIDGDATIGRNVVVGGNSTIRGMVTVGHNLKVEGWLEARNVKTPLKGLFKDEETLQRVYPHPQPGWWALVGDALPAALYVADCSGKASNGPTWMATGREAGELTLELNCYDERLGAIEERMSAQETGLRDLSDELTAAVKDCAGEFARIDAAHGALSEFVDGLSGALATVKARCDEREAAAAETAAALERMQQRVELLVTYCDNLANALNEHCQGDYRSVVNLASVEWNEDVAVATQQGTTLQGGSIYYVAGFKERRPFVLRTVDGDFYERWSTDWWVYDADGEPRGDVLMTHGGRLYQWGGRDNGLIEVSGSGGTGGGCDCDRQAISAAELDEIIS